MRVDRRLINNFDWGTLALIVLISVIGILTIYSGTRHPISGETPSFYLKQLNWLCLSIIALIVIVSIDYVWLMRFSYTFYGFGIVLLILVLLMGRTGMGAQRWLNLGFISFQPSEIFKLFYVIAVAHYLSAVRTKVGLGDLVKTFSLLALVPVLLIAKQPDLGTAVINYSDSVTPGAGAQVAFNGNLGTPPSTSIYKDNVLWKTVFFTTPLEAFPAANQQTVFNRILDYCDALFQDGFDTGSSSRWTQTFP